MPSVQEPISPLRIIRLRHKGLTFRKIGILIAKEDGREMPYHAATYSNILHEYRKGKRDKDGYHVK